MQVPVEAYVKDVPNPSAAELQKFFDEHKETISLPDSPESGFREPRRVDVQYLKADTAKIAAAVTDAEVKQEYEKNKENYDRMEREMAKPAAESKPAETKPAETKPAETKPAEPAKPAAEPEKAKDTGKPAKEGEKSAPPAKSGSSLMPRSPFRFVSYEQEKTADGAGKADAKTDQPAEKKTDQPAEKKKSMPPRRR